MSATDLIIDDQLFNYSEALLQIVQKPTDGICYNPIGKCYYKMGEGFDLDVNCRFRVYDNIENILKGSVNSIKEQMEASGNTLQPMSPKMTTLVD